MEQQIEAFINYLHNVKKTSKNTELSYRRDLKKVAVPVRLENSSIGEARVTAARTRPKFIGGERAVYNEAIK